jgi:hypothetical protein
MRKFFVLAVTLLLSVVAMAQDNAFKFRGFAPTPPMGWNSFDCHGSSVKESQVVANANYMKVHGLLDNGWKYVVVDIRWYTDDNGGYYNQTGTQKYTYDKYGRYLPDTGRFPSAADGNGFKALADSLHKMGFKFGIHVMRGIPKVAVTAKCPILGTNYTCDQIYNEDSLCVWLGDNYTIDCTKPAAQAYYNSIVNLYAAWGVDFIKVDDLSRPYHDGEIQLIRNAIDQCGRDIVLSMSPGKTSLDKWESCQQHANMWRMMDDFWDRWSDMQQEFQLCERWNQYRITGCYPDCDMLPLGQLDMGSTDNGGRWTKFTHDEQLTMVTLWSIFKSPMMFGGDFRFNDDWTNSLLLNQDMVYVNQHSVNNRLISNNGTHIVWAADAPDSNVKYVALFNAGDLGSWIKYNGALFASETITNLTNGYGTDVDIALPDTTTQLALVVDDAGDGNNYDHGDWINPRVVLADGTETRLNSHAVASKDLTGSYYKYVNFNKNLEGGNLSVNGTKYTYGMSAHANAMVLFNIPTGAKRFKAFCGLDDAGRTQTGSTSSVRFFVYNYDPTKTQSTTDSASETIPLNLPAVGIDKNTTCEIYDIWNKKTVGTFSGTSFAPAVNRHGCAFYRIVPTTSNGIKSTTCKQHAKAKGIYALNGRKINEPIDTLPRNIYIIDGVKTIKRSIR